MFTTNSQSLQSDLDSLTPKNADYEQYVSNFSEENIFSFIVNLKNISLIDIANIARKNNFCILKTETIFIPTEYGTMISEDNELNKKYRVYVREMS
jgi:hypothetical protein